MRILVTVLLLAACVGAGEQGDLATVEGRVVEGHRDLATVEGRVVEGKDMRCPGALVTLVALDTKAEVMVRMTASDGQGMYRFAKVAPGQYLVVAELEPSFPLWGPLLAEKYQDVYRRMVKELNDEQLRIWKHDRVHVAAGAVVRHDIKLPIAARLRWARAQCKRYYEVAKLWGSREGKRPQDLSQIVTAPAREGTPTFYFLTDPWGGEFRIENIDGLLFVVSNGLDGLPNTQDDISHPPR